MKKPKLTLLGALYVGCARVRKLVLYRPKGGSVEPHEDGDKPKEMKKVLFYWQCRNLDVILPIIRSGWVSGFNVNHRSTATVRNQAQQKELDKMVENGWIKIIQETEVKTD